MSDNIVTEALVNKKTGEVVEIGLQKTPDEIMVDASDAARALEKLILSNKRKPMEFNGKRYLEFPHWQTVGKFYHTTAASGDAVFVEINGIKGFKATGRIIDEKTGLMVGSAEAYCMTDEPNWKNKPLFQLASMAQTRAACKALSNKYRYVAIVAGYEPTPGEEVDMSREMNLRPPREIESPPPPETEIPFGGDHETAPEGVAGNLITEKQRKMLFARSRAKGIPEADMKQFLWDSFTLEHSKDLSRAQFEDVLKWVDNYQPGGKAA